MSGIFISYRRQDSAASAGRLCDRLGAEFGAEQVFMDVDDIPPGADFSAQISAKVRGCDALLAVIGKQWLTARNADGQLRLSDPNDLVGREIALALKRGILVIPVLVEGASMPKAADLRNDLKPLAQRNAVTISDQDFQGGVAKLIKTLETLPGLRKQVSRVGDDWKSDMRQRLRRRLVWKIPLIMLLVSFAVWWQWRQQVKDIAPPNAPIITDSLAAKLTGRWRGEVVYPWGAKYQEEFLFTPEGNTLFGTASFIGIKRGIEDGRVTGGTITFKVRFEETSGGSTRVGTNRYEGNLSGDNLLIKFFDEAGSPPVEIKLSRQSDAETSLPMKRATP
jgi:hypothetical protein